MTPRWVLWRRLDGPGHDACRLGRSGTSWTLDGMAVFRDADHPAQLVYHLTCDAAWRAKQARVTGWMHGRDVDLTVQRRHPGRWTLNGRTVADLEEVPDFDLGFTPATNLPHIQRIALAEGESADVPAVWLDVAGRSLVMLRQRYMRRSASSYLYQAPRFGYEDVLEVGRTGFVVRYPGLWEVEPVPSRS